LAGDLGFANNGVPEWALACSRPVADWLRRLEILALDVGLLFSLNSSCRIALTQSERASEALKVLAPWALSWSFCSRSESGLFCNRSRCVAPFQRPGRSLTEKADPIRAE
jgi:hypothetical protein